MWGGLLLLLTSCCITVYLQNRDYEVEDIDGYLVIEAEGKTEEWDCCPTLINRSNGVLSSLILALYILYMFNCIASRIQLIIPIPPRKLHPSLIPSLSQRRRHRQRKLP